MQEEREGELTIKNDIKNNGFDTLICAAKKDGFKTAFLDQKAWWAVRIKKENISSIKYLAIYQVAPISALTHYGEVDKIELYEDGDKYKIYLKDVVKLNNDISIGDDPYLRPQGPRYTKLKDLLASATLDDLFGNNS